ncbi:MAG: heat-inducible transcriptional repressor HrcA [Lachnospiraceae bacterium]|jgi:heat-inducible transcriptional repressor|nr:heat-inducible transcriptional repressor HrcA [Lachnospiraceae bacterium]
MGVIEELTERKRKILYAIIKNYLETGEPVGSRTISKETDLNLSSATIRNEMADLVELGYIIQPHTSAGRIPSDKGYRFYVNELMKEKEQELDVREEKMLQQVDKMEKLLSQAAKVLANDTNYATLVSAPTSNRVKFIQLTQVDETQIIAVIVMTGNIIKNRIIEVEGFLTAEELLKLNMLLNTTLNGMTVDEINLTLMAKLREQAGEYSEVIGHVLESLAEFALSENDTQIYTSGATNIFKYPELRDKESAQEIIEAFEEKQKLSDLVNQTLANEDNTGIQVYIGDESPVPNMEDVSVVTATYDMGEGVKGTIGIIGPKRMDYKHVLKSLRTLQDELGHSFDKVKKKKPSDEKEDKT